MHTLGGSDPTAVVKRVNRLVRHRGYNAQTLVSGFQNRKQKCFQLIDISGLDECDSITTLLSWDWNRPSRMDRPSRPSAFHRLLVPIAISPERKPQSSDGVPLDSVIDQHNILRFLNSIHWLSIVLIVTILEGPLPRVLQQVTIQIQSNAQCKKNYGSNAPGDILNSMICGGLPGKDSCQVNFIFI